MGVPYLGLSKNETCFIFGLTKTRAELIASTYLDFSKLIFARCVEALRFPELNIGTLRFTPTVENPNHRLLLSKNTKSSEKLL